jgi:predicted unusual protein kinase regulating ubiquinone biosynthesis (AarF/ABC1/UbiB family)
MARLKNSAEPIRVERMTIPRKTRAGLSLSTDRERYAENLTDGHSGGAWHQVRGILCSLIPEALALHHLTAVGIREGVSIGREAVVSKEPNIPKGRLKRLSKLVGLTTQVGTNLVVDRAKRLLGGAGDPKVELAQKVFATLGELKGAAMKAGQSLSMFAEQLPPEARQVLAGLFSQAPTRPYAEIAAVIESELRAPPGRVFASFEEQPMAAASLGQVHRARLHGGEDVVVKVQYPGVAAAMEADLKNVHALVRGLSLGGKILDRREFVEEMDQQLRGELDYRAERQRLEQFRSYVARWPDLVVPKAYPDVSTGRVLVMERLEGPTLDQYVKNIDAVSEEERFAIGERLVRAVYGPFLYYRRVHGDAHPGNYVVMPGRLGILDFGLVKELSERFWRASLDVVDDAVNGRPMDLNAITRRAGFTIDLPDDRASTLLAEVAKIIGKPLLGAYDFASAHFAEEFIELRNRRLLELMHIRPPPESLFYYRSLVGLAANLKSLKASGDFRPFFRRALRDLHGLRE